MMRMRRPIGAAIVMLCVAMPAAASDKQHLPFFGAHRDWVLRAFENLPKPGAPADAAARAWSFDPFADEQAMQRIRAVRAALDSATTLADLGVFRTALDSLLGAAELTGARLDSLDRCFARHLRTALEVTLASKAALDVERVEAYLDGALVEQHALSAEERAALAAGGVLEVMHRVVEPRAQALEVRAWTRGAAAPSTTALVVQPTPDELSIYHLDLESAQSPARSVRSSLGGRD
jgi:hypothetical protein